MPSPNDDIFGLLPKSMLKLATGIVFSIAILITFINEFPFYTVESGYTGVVLKWNAASDQVVTPGGLHFRVPFYESITMISAQPMTVRSQESASTHDLQNVDTMVAVTFHIAPEQAPDFYRNFRTLENLSNRIIAPTVSNDVKAVTADYNAEELVTKREIVDGRIRDLVISSLRPYHVTIEAVNTANFKFSPVYEKAIEDKQVSQQQALQAEYTLQSTRINAQQQVVQAKAQADANIATATGQAQATLLTAQAQSKANAMIAASITPPLLRLKGIEKWNGHLPTYTGGNGPLPFLDVAGGMGSMTP